MILRKAGFRVNGPLVSLFKLAGRIEPVQKNADVRL